MSRFRFWLWRQWHWREARRIDRIAAQRANEKVPV